MSVLSTEPFSRCSTNRDIFTVKSAPACLSNLITSRLDLDSLLYIDPPSLILLFCAILALCSALRITHLYLHHRSSTMLVSLIFSLLGTVLLSAPSVLAIEKPVNPDLSTKLKMAVTHLDFWNSLSDSDYVFDFTAQTPEPFKPGSVLNANVATWPLLMSGDQAIAQLNFGACAMLSPHYHPHATNIVVTVAGELRTYMRAENGAIDRQTVLTPGKMTIFPKASVHAMVNEGCTNAQAYSFLSSADPGTLNLAQAFFASGPDIGMQVMPFISLADGDWNATAQKILPVGTGSQEGYKACRERCGIAD